MRSYFITTKNYIKELNQDTRYNVYGNFLDRFRYCATDEERQIIISERPDDEDEKYAIDLAKLAATVEVLAKEYNLKTPEWIFDEKYCLSEPYFAGIKDKDYIRLLIESTPEEFKRRKVFLGDNVMARA